MKSSMKKFVLQFIAPVFALSSVAMSEEDLDVPPVELSTSLSQIYTVEGFDDNDQAELALYGTLPSTCYQVGDVKTSVNKDTKEITVMATSFYYKREICIPMEVPFLHVVKLGVLNAGAYKVAGISYSHDFETLTIKEHSNSKQDDFIYAPIDFADVITDAQGREFLEIKGRFPLMKDGCMAFKEIRTYKGNQNIIVAQPITKILSTQECGDQSQATSFHVKHPLEFNVEGQKTGKRQTSN